MHVSLIAKLNTIVESIYFLCISYSIHAVGCMNQTLLRPEIGSFRNQWSGAKAVTPGPGATDTDAKSVGAQPHK